ncbi:MAG TPA: hypothetical protein VGL97_22450 [Bryobacteraceae bacterium]|jgi:hypothetical protein
MFTISSKWTAVRLIAGAMLCLVILALGLTPRAVASEWDKKTIVTFNVPLEIPGKVLPPGTYVFKRLDSAADHNIVQIFDKDEKQLYATVLAIPDYRLQPADKPIIQFEERPSNSPPAIKAWFYPGDEYGLQLVYTNDRARALAKRTNQNVLSMRNEMGQNITASANSANAPSVRALEKAEVTAMNPSGQQVGMEQAASTKPTSSH